VVLEGSAPARTGVLRPLARPDDDADGARRFSVGRLVERSVAEPRVGAALPVRTRPVGVPARADPVLRVVPPLRAAAPVFGTRLGNDADGRLAGPPRVVRATDTGVRPTVGVRAARSPAAVLVLGAAAALPPDRAAPTLGLDVLAVLDPVRPFTAGARRFTEVTPFGRDFAAAATTVLDGAATVGVAPERRCAVRPVVPFPGLSLYRALPA